MKKTLVILACLTALAILFASPVLAKNNVSAEADSISWAYDQNGSLIGTIIKTDGVPAGIPAHIAGQLVEGKISEYERIYKKEKISKVFSFPMKVSIVQKVTKITYSKAGGWKEFDFSPIVKESEENYYFLSVVSAIFPAVCIFLFTLIHFLGFGKIRLQRLSIFYGWTLFLILAAGLSNFLRDFLSSPSIVISLILFVGVIAILLFLDSLHRPKNNFIFSLFFGFAVSFLLPIFASSFLLPGAVWQYFLLFVLVCLGSCLFFYTIQGGQWLVRRHRAKSAQTA